MFAFAATGGIYLHLKLQCRLINKKLDRNLVYIKSILFCLGEDYLDFVYPCKTENDFDEQLYRPSANGEFLLQLKEAAFDIENIGMVMFELSGSSIDLGFFEIAKISD